MAWKDCTYCGKKLNGCAAISRHMRAAHPREQALLDVEAGKRNLARAQWAVEEFHEFHDALTHDGLRPSVQRLVERALKVYPFSAGLDGLESDVKYAAARYSEVQNALAALDAPVREVA